MSNFNSIDTFKTNFKGGTRPNRFSVIATWPQNIGAANPVDMKKVTTFKISSAEFPESTVNSINTFYRGRKINFAGDRQYSPWTITVLDDTGNYSLWKIFHTWIEKIDGHQSHLYAGAPDFDYSSHQTTFTLNQYGLNGGANNGIEGDSGIRTIKLWNVWPISVEPFPLNMGDGSYVEFSVRLVFDYISFEGDTINTSLT